MRSGPWAASRVCGVLFDHFSIPSARPIGPMIVDNLGGVEDIQRFDQISTIGEIVGHFFTQCDFHIGRAVDQRFGYAGLDFRLTANNS